MDEVFLEIVTAKFTTADFKKHQLQMPMHQDCFDLRLVFFTEADYSTYVKELEKECDNLLSQYWLIRSSELIDKNRFIIKVLTIVRQEYLKKTHCSY